MTYYQNLYFQEVRPKLLKEKSYPNLMAVPRLTKICLNMGVSESAGERKVMEQAVQDMALIAGQKPLVTVARRSIAGFKIREGYPLGCKVTLRHRRMYEFLERLIGIAIPRERDFRGLNPNSFDGDGNFSMGITEQIIFPEIDYDNIDRLRGMDITFVTTARNDEDGLTLLRALNFPFKSKPELVDG